MTRRKLAKTGLLGMLMLLATTGWAVPSRNHVLGLLEGRHWQLNAAAFRKLGPGTETVLQELADDPTLINYLRFRTLEALTAFPEDETADFLEDFSQRTEPALARRGVEALSRGFGQTHPQHVQRTAAALSRHPNPQVRLSAGRALKDTAPEQFQRLMRTEPEAWVREALKQKE
jgi:hypothetical protein